MLESWGRNRIDQDFSIPLSLSYVLKNHVSEHTAILRKREDKHYRVFFLVLLHRFNPHASGG